MPPISIKKSPRRFRQWHLELHMPKSWNCSNTFRAWSLKSSMLSMRLCSSGYVQRILDPRLLIDNEMLHKLAKALVRGVLLTLPQIRSAVTMTNGETISIASKFVASSLASKSVSVYRSKSLLSHSLFGKSILNPYPREPDTISFRKRLAGLSTDIRITLYIFSF